MRTPRPRPLHGLSPARPLLVRPLQARQPLARLPLAWLPLVWLLAACQTTSAPPVVDDDDDDSAVDVLPFEPGPEPSGMLGPEPGELWIAQLDLPPTQLGEAAIVVGPTGDILLIDVGDDSHDDDVRAVIEELNRDWLTPARGYPMRGLRQVEWILVTHFHRDHMGALDQLLTGDEALQPTRGVVHRGWTDVGPALSENDFEEVCTLLRGSLSGLDQPLCQSDSLPDCDARGARAPLVDCPGLPGALDLGGGAELVLLGAAGVFSDGSAAHPAAPFPVEEGGQENARSIVGLIEFGAFRYHFGGDLTGSGEADEPDMETPFVEAAGPVFYAPLGADVSHAHHHARDSSSSLALVDLLAPRDGRTRQVVAGLNELYLPSPQRTVLEMWTASERLAGGGFWVPRLSLGSATPAAFPELVVAQGPVYLRTIDGGAGYWMQGGATTRAAPSVRR